jgi:hypothetical protein
MGYIIVLTRRNGTIHTAFHGNGVYRVSWLSQVLSPTFALPELRMVGILTID